MRARLWHEDTTDFGGLTRFETLLKESVTLGTN